MTKPRSTVILSAWVDPVVRDLARVEAKASGIAFSKFIERAVQRACLEASVARAVGDAKSRGGTTQPAEVAIAKTVGLDLSDGDEMDPRGRP